YDITHGGGGAHDIMDVRVSRCDCWTGGGIASGFKLFVLTPSSQSEADAETYPDYPCAQSSDAPDPFALACNTRRGHREAQVLALSRSEADRTLKFFA